MNAFAAIKTYANVEFESGVNGADPHSLVLMLYRGALLAIEQSKQYIQQNNVEGKNRSIKHATAIIEQGLNASLDKRVGGQLAQNLGDLYEYMVQRLLVANLKNDIGALDEVHRLLSELKEAWEGIGQQVKQMALAAPVVGTNRSAQVYGQGFAAAAYR
ncbi:MAG: flagellar export chaperone FliS [Pseudomonadota bacterium]